MCVSVCVFAALQVCYAVCICMYTNRQTRTITHPNAYIFTNINNYVYDRKSFEDVMNDHLLYQCNSCCPTAEAIDCGMQS